MSLVYKMAENGRLTIDQKEKVVLFYAETKSVVATQRRFRAHVGTRWAPCKQTIYRLSLGTIFQPVRINSVPDIKCFCNNKNVLCVQSMVWHFVRHSVIRNLTLTIRNDQLISDTSADKSKKDIKKGFSHFEDESWARGLYRPRTS